LAAPQHQALAHGVREFNQFGFWMLSAGTVQRLKELFALTATQLKLDTGPFLVAIADIPFI
jgi:hypothetical protein